MALKKTATGKVDKRTTEYKEMVERAKKAREAAKKEKEKAAKKEKEKAAKKSDKKTTASSGVKRKADGKVDLRTKEGKAITERMEKARKAKEKNKKKGGVLSRLIKKLV